MKTYTTRHGLLKHYWTAHLEGKAGTIQCAHTHSSEWDAVMCAVTLGNEYKLVQFGA